MLPRHDRAINQICSLERSVQRTGREQITHPIHGTTTLRMQSPALATSSIRAPAIGPDSGMRIYRPSPQRRAGFMIFAQSVQICAGR
jgi:hypothetical protein